MIKTRVFRHDGAIWATDGCCVMRVPDVGDGFEVVTPDNFDDVLAEARASTRSEPEVAGKSDRVWVGPATIRLAYWFAIVAMHGNKVEWCSTAHNKLVAAMAGSVVVAVVMPVVDPPAPPAPKLLH